ncbi:C40 family peptidase [Streptosporangium saharense]|uniref:C40 family peptidase n=1 Tax=Streptosporangium saharense TaxID=1706840 RepID=UPI0036795E5E
MHSVRGRRGHVVAVVSGLACCLVVGVDAGSGAMAQAHTGPTAHEVAEARSKAVERSKQLDAATTRLDEARERLGELVALKRASTPPGEADERPDTPAKHVEAGTAEKPDPQKPDVLKPGPKPVREPKSGHEWARPDLEADEDEILVQVWNVGPDGQSRTTISGFGPEVTGQADEVRQIGRERARLRTETQEALTTAQRLVAERETAKQEKQTRRKREAARKGRSRARVTAQSARVARVRAVPAAQTTQTAQVAQSAGATEQTRGNIVADWALTQIDKPYVWASAGPTGYDCSGLTMQAWSRVGVKMDHWTGTQWTAGRHVPYDRLQRGDLLFFGRRTRKPDDIRHVGIYVGNGMMVHAPQTGDVVRVAPMWRKDLIGATRPA